MLIERRDLKTCWRDEITDSGESSPTWCRIGPTAAAQDAAGLNSVCSTSERAYRASTCASGLRSQSMRKSAETKERGRPLSGLQTNDAAHARGSISAPAVDISPRTVQHTYTYVCAWSDATLAAGCPGTASVKRSRNSNQWQNRLRWVWKRSWG